ncbi:MAG: NAD(P)-binding protein [Ilumatobacter sp.]|nr:NAD(P)-binding protein [Ilumatobacter sp.]
MTQTSNNSREQRPTIIVGGGVSGLTAAKTLEDAGMPVVLLEGSDRLGGRIHTLDLEEDDASWIDMGAGWILDHRTNPVFHMLKDAGTEVRSVPVVGPRVRIYDHGSATWKQWTAAMKAYGKFGWALMRPQPISSEFSSLGERFDERLGNQPKREDAYLLKSFLEILIGSSVDDMHQNMLSEVWEHVEHKGTSMVMITGGYRHLVELLSNALSTTEVMLNQTVSQVSIPQNSSTAPLVAVETSDGRTYQGARVIITVPLGVLKAGSIAFDPPLPPAKQDAIERIGFGTVEKVVMTFENAFWRRNRRKPMSLFSIADPVAADGMYVDVSATSGSGPGAPTSHCLAYVCGNTKAELVAENPEAAVEQVLSDLQTIFPDTFEPPVATATSRWRSSPFSQGSYAYPSVHTEPGDFTKLGEPTHDGMVLFAGDACAEGTALGYVEGAIFSGERAAKDVLAATGRNISRPVD